MFTFLGTRPPARWEARDSLKPARFSDDGEFSTTERFLEDYDVSIINVTINDRYQ